MAASGKSISGAMSTEMPIPSFDPILVLGEQLARFPLADDTEANIRTAIGPHVEEPMVLESSMFASRMVFDTLSGNAKIALVKGSDIAKTAICSGEGDILHEEMDASYRYIYELAPNKCSFDRDVLKHSSVIEIRISQDTKPDMGGHLPGAKVTPTR